MKRPAIPITMIHIAVEDYFVLYKFPQGFAVTAGACALFLFLEFDVHGTQGGLYLFYVAFQIIGKYLLFINNLLSIT